MNLTVIAFAWGAVAMTGTVILRHSHKRSRTWTRGNMVGAFVGCHLFAPIVLMVMIIAAIVRFADYVTELTYKPRAAWTGWWSKPGW